jgi:excinuclease ABC subunit C
VDSLFASRRFTSFGPTGLGVTCDAPVLHRAHARQGKELRAQIRQTCPQHPGVYGMVASDGELLYVGKAKRLRTRLLTYFRPNSRDAKAGRIIARTRTLVWEIHPSEFAALLRELELIRRWRPSANVQGQPGRRRPTFVCLGRPPAPYVFLARRPPSGILVCFGPVPGGRRARAAVRRVNDWFQLRDCPRVQEMVFADQGELFPVSRTAGCLRLEIGTCLGPCAAVCTRRNYEERVRAARAFLAGEDVSALEELKRTMNAASSSLEFERAAALRDKLETLRWLNDRLERLRHARNCHSFIYPVPAEGGEDRWYLIRRGCVRAVLPAPCDRPCSRSAAARIEALFSAASAWSEPTTAEQLDGVLLVASWFHRHPEERARTLRPEEAVAAYQASAFTGNGLRPVRLRELEPAE